MTPSTTAKNAMLNAFAALLNSGKLVFQTAAGVEVATCTFGATAFATASASSITANAITGDADAAGGTIGKLSLQTSASAEIAVLTVGLTGSSADIKMSSLVVAIGEAVNMTSLVINMT